MSDRSGARLIPASVLAALLSVAAASGIAAQDRELGPAARPQPEDLNLMPNGLRVGARVVLDGSGDPAMTSAPGDRLRFEAGFLPGDDLPAGSVVLDCTLRFVGADGRLSAPVKQGTCFDGRRDVARGEWLLLDVTTVFRPTATDPDGTSGVRIDIADTVSGARLTLMPTYGFAGGAE